MQHIGQVSTRDERWNTSTSKPSKLVTVKCQSMSKTWHHDMPQHSAILRSPPHTRPWPPRHQSGCLPNWYLWRTCLSSAPRPRPGGSNRSRLARCSRVLPSKPDHWNPANNWHSTATCRISLIQNLEKQSRIPRFYSATTYSMAYSWIASIWQLNSIRDERWNYSTSKPSKLLTVRGCRKHDIMTCRSIQRFCGAHHTPGLHTLVANLVVGQIDVCDWRIYLQCLG